MRHDRSCSPWSISLTVWIATLGFSAHALAAPAGVKISSGKTSHMACSGGICAATGRDAVLNASDLEGMLASGNVTVMTGKKARNIEIAARLGWSTSNMLTLDAARSIAIGKAVTIQGTGGLTLVTNDGGSGGTLSFGRKGHVAFDSLSSTLTINGAVYTLAGSISGLAGDIAANAGGNYALAKNYDAAADGTYASSPIATNFTGTFEGLGNTISHLGIDDTVVGASEYVGLFAQLSSTGVVRDIGLLQARISAGQQGATTGYDVGALVAESGSGSIENAYASGTVTVLGTGGGFVGGLVGYGGGMIQNCRAAVSVSGTGFSLSLGGLIGVWGYGTANIEGSYATGAVTGTGAGGSGGGEDQEVLAGGLVGSANPSTGGIIENSYATGAVSAVTSGAPDTNAWAGGLVGYDGVQIATSYATGTASAGGAVQAYAGGLVGYEYANDFSDDYWDTTTSGTGRGVGFGNTSGLTGLTTAQFQSGLPAGFTRKIWREKSNINGAMPYLRTNPPRQ